MITNDIATTVKGFANCIGMLVKRVKCLIICCTVTVVVNIVMLYHLQHQPPRRPGSSHWKSDTVRVGGGGWRRTEPDQAPVPNIVYTILWGGPYTFQNYLSLLSAVRHLQPYRVFMFVAASSHNVTADRWFRRATASLPQLEVRGLRNYSGGGPGGGGVGGGGADRAAAERDSRIQAVVFTVRRFGGIYVDSSTVITSSLHEIRQSQFHVGLTSRGQLSYMAAGPEVASVSHVMLAMGMVWKKITSPSVSTCSEVGDDVTFDHTAVCVTFTSEVVKQPSGIMYGRTGIAVLARSLMYGQTDVFSAERRSTPIPNIVHYVWLGDKEITYSMVLSFLSTVKFVNPRKVFIYVTNVPEGGYWSTMVAHPRVEFIVYGPVTSLYGVHLRYLSHASDVIRADVLLRYGGVYVDWDVVWIRPIKELLDTGYEAIVAPDRPPNTLNPGIALAQPGAHIIRLWQESFKSYTGHHPTAHAIEALYRVYEDNPGSVYIERNLQIQCYHLHCNGNTINGYRDKQGIESLMPMYAIHFSQGSPVEFTSERILRMSKGVFACIGKHVLD